MVPLILQEPQDIPSSIPHAVLMTNTRPGEIESVGFSNPLALVLKVTDIIPSLRSGLRLRHLGKKR